MKILIIGFLVLFSWSALSTYIWVCKIKGLCNEQEQIEIGAVNNRDIIVYDTITKPVSREQSVIPDNLLIYFAFDKYEFISDAKTTRYFDESSAYLKKNSQAMLSITGHTDAIGSSEYNQALGLRRAQGVQNYFESKGLSGKKILVESRGEKEPAEDNNTEAGRANNRRTVITIKN